MQHAVVTPLWRGCSALWVQAGGNVVRLAGLYHAQRGAHTYFLRAGRVQRAGDAVVNLVHYEDAARLAVAVS